MSSYKYIFLLFISFVSLTTYGQRKGKLIIEINGGGDTDESDTAKKNIQYVLLRHDTVFFKLCDLKLETTWTIDSVESGNYTLKINSDSSILATFNEIIVKAERVNRFEFDFNSIRYKYYNKNDTAKVTVGKSDITINTLYGNNSSYEPSRFKRNQLLSADIAANYYKPLAKYYSIGIKVGGHYAHTNFDNDTSSYLGKRTLNKYYSTAGINIGFINRFTFFNNKYLFSDGLKLDIGISYNLPFFFRQITEAENHTRITTRRIHTYTDFSAIVRLGYKYVGLQAEYSLSDYLKSAYTEPPELKIGLVFYFPASN